MFNILLFAPEYRPNLSSMIRTSEFYGLNKIYIYDKNGLLTPPKTSNGKSEMAHMAKVWTAGAIEYIEVIKIENYEEFFNQYEGRIISTILDKEAEKLNEFQFKKNDLIVMGSEKNGLTPQAIELTDHKIYLPQKGNTNCLNVAVTLGITLNQAFNSLERI